VPRGGCPGPDCGSPLLSNGERRRRSNEGQCLLLAASLLFDPQPASLADSIGPSGDFLGADALRLHCPGMPFDVFPDHDCHVCRRKPVALCLGDDALCELAPMLFSRLMLQSGRRPLLSYSGAEAARDPNGVEPRIPGRTVPGGCHAEAREARQGSVALPSSRGSGKARGPSPRLPSAPQRSRHSTSRGKAAQPHFLRRS
jgi:hypothetical protein